MSGRSARKRRGKLRGRSGRIGSADGMNERSAREKSAMCGWTGSAESGPIGTPLSSAGQSACLPSPSAHNSVVSRTLNVDAYNSPGRWFSRRCIRVAQIKGKTQALANISDYFVKASMQVCECMVTGSETGIGTV